MLNQSASNNDLNPALENDSNVVEIDEEEKEIEIANDIDDTTTEENKLLPKENHDVWYNDIPWSKAASLLTKLGFAAVAACSVMLYIEPSEKCAHLPGCGENVPGAKALGIVGSSEYLAVNMALGAEALDAIKEAFSVPESLLGKVAMGGWLLVFSSGNVCQIMFVSSATSSDPLKILMAAVGAIPAAVYGASKMTTIELRQFFSAVYNRFLMPNPDTASDKNALLPVEVALTLKRYQYYSQRFAEFKTQLNEKYHHFVTTLRDAKLNGDEHPLASLYAQGPTSPDTSWVANTLGHLMATTSTTAMSIPLFLTTEEFVESMAGVENEWFKAMLSIAINAPLIYANFKMSDLVTTAATNFLDSIVRCKPVNSLLWQLSKTKTLLAVAASTAVSAYSYVVIGVVWRHLFPEDKQTIMEIEAYASKVGIDIYHLGGSMKLFEIAWKFFAQDKAKFAFAIEEEFKKLSNYTLEQFVEFCEKDESRIQFGLQSYAEYEQTLLSENIEAPVLETENVHPSQGVPQNYSQRGFFSRLFCCDSAPSPAASPTSSPSLRRSSEDES